MEVMEEAEVTSSTDVQSQSKSPIESVKSSILELEREFAASEKELRELVEIRKTAEILLEKARAKYNEEKSRFHKAQESLTVTKHKAEQVNNQAKGLEDSSNVKRKKITELREEIMKYKKKHLRNVEDFEENLKQMCELFQNAVGFYTDEELNEAIKKTEQEREDMRKMLEQTEHEISKMNSELEDLSHQPLPDPWALDIALEQRKIIVQFFQTEHAAAVKILEKVRQEKQALEDEIRGVSNST